MASKQRGTYEYKTDRGIDIFIEIVYEEGLIAASPETRLTKGGFGDKQEGCLQATVRRSLKPRHIYYKFAENSIQRVYVQNPTLFNSLLDDINTIKYCGECGC